MNKLDAWITGNNGQDQFDDEDRENFVNCCRCKIEEHEDDMLEVDLGYLCECCEGGFKMRVSKW